MKGVVFNLLEQVVVREYGENVWDDLLDTAGTGGWSVDQSASRNRTTSGNAPATNVQLWPPVSCSYDAGTWAVTNCS